MHTEIIARLEEADDLDLPLVKRAMRACGITEFDAVWWRVRKLAECGAFLDAAVALVERVLPGQEWSAGSRDSSGNAWGKVRVAPLESIQDSGSSPSIALLLALFRALDARSEKESR